MAVPPGKTDPAADIGNWRLHPYSRWGFQHVRELVPTASLPAAPRRAPSETRRGEGSIELFSIRCESRFGTIGLGDLLSRAHCDGFIVLHRGKPAGQWCAPWFNPANPHILFSVSKSLTGLLVGILAGNGLLDPRKPVSHYVSGLQHGVYGECSLRDLLDMTVALNFEEEYVDPYSEYVRYRIATGWNAVDQRAQGPGLESFLKSLQGTGEPHGERFLYRSPNSDMLGLVVQEASGIPFAQVFSDLLWQPMSATTDGYVTLDSRGLARAAGGICITLADLAGVGQLLLQRGAKGNHQVVAESWVDDTWSAGNRDAWLKGNYQHKLPDGRYRNQWYQMGDADDCLHARGIHGQLLYINPAREVVIARVSSQPDPLDDVMTSDMIRAFHGIARLLGDRV